jgi:hypothetical protein
MVLRMKGHHGGAMKFKISSRSGINGFTKWGFQAVLISFDHQHHHCHHHKERIP